jgi:hypothetical protein
LVYNWECFFLSSFHPVLLFFFLFYFVFSLFIFFPLSSPWLLS